MVESFDDMKKPLTGIRKILYSAGWLAGGGMAIFGMGLMSAMLHTTMEIVEKHGSNTHDDLIDIGLTVLGAIMIGIAVNKVAQALIYLSKEDQ